jgi:hypothetical protein
MVLDTPDPSSPVVNVYLYTFTLVSGDGLHFRFDVRTSLDISDVGFFPSYERHSFDLFASSGTKPDILYLNLDSGECLTVASG